MGLRYLIALGVLLAGLWPAVAGAGVQVRDSEGVHHFARVPQRVVALSWESAESLLELGVTPLAVADAVDYRVWVVQPALPAPVRSAGSRLEPNLELLAELKPDLIIISPIMRDLLPQLSRIAPVLNFDSYRNDHDNAVAAREAYLQLGEVFDRRALATQRLAQLDRRFAALDAQLRQHFGPHLPQVNVIRFASPAVAYRYGDNSMPLHALQRLGLATSRSRAASAWGVTQLKVADLGQLGDSIVLYQQPFAQGARLFGTPLWRAMPFVRGQRFAAVRSTWSYGGYFSLYYLARAMTEALLTLPPPTRAAR
jgi:iron complex transport system substrate-binding protein